MCTQEMWQRDGFAIGTMSALRCFCWGEEKMILRNPDGGQLTVSGDDWKALLGYARGGDTGVAGTPR